MKIKNLIVVSLLSALTACGGGTVDSSKEASATPAAKSQPDAATAHPGVPRDPERQAYFGDLHVHTMYSFDAFIFGTTASPDDAYTFAKGGTLRHPGGFDMTLPQPLDFYAVTDHAFYMGALRAMADPAQALSKHELSQGMDDLDNVPEGRRGRFNKIIQLIRSDRKDELLDPAVFKSAWDDTIAAANRHYDPGTFTTFIGYEFTASGDAFENLHRNVIFRGEKGPDLPYSRLASNDPETLWNWMDELRAQGIESLAIPHNSNGSDGMMFSLQDFTGKPLDASYADLRMRNEPLVEITQIKGTSDTHPALSPNDEWANFEIMPYKIATMQASRPDGSYVRQALLRGMELEEKQGFNPFKFGFIGSSDTHNASSDGPEDDHWGKTGKIDDSPAERASIPMKEPGEDGSRYRTIANTTWSAAGFAGVWAESNTREDIYDAFRRRETFATTGPRIKVRFFAGADMPEPNDPRLISRAYAAGVPMGGELSTEGKTSPEFLVWAAQDASSAGLQRLQIVKGVIRNGKPEEKVFDIACSDGGVVDPATHRCPDNGASVDLTTCRISADKGAADLRTVWRDPEFNSSENAFYYVRVLENPTCRWSTWDAIRSGYEPRPDYPATIQERAWSSPIWVAPADA
ncbi:MAG: DUF3604 domain-containing protein [Pseudomonadales bacterium]|nr:DUF3604 domain-containing protein [Pseudomonadales bacterium]